MDRFPYLGAAPAALTRRGFVAGLDGVITAAFLRRVARHVAASGEPLWRSARL